MSIPELHIENRFPDCVALKLHLEDDPVSKARPPLSLLVRAGETRCQSAFRLSLSVTFSGEQEIEIPRGKRLGLPGGQVSFGVRRGQLRFSLDNCLMPQEKRALVKPFPISREVEIQTTQARELEASTSLDSRNVGAKASQGSTEKTMVDVFQVKTSGSDDNPAWVFESYDDKAILEGALAKTLLGILNITELPYEIKAEFTVRGEDIKITWGKIGLAQDIHRNKLALIERFIALLFIKPMVEKSPLCKGRGEYV